MVSQLIERIRQKDQRAMSQLYQIYVGKLSSVCYRYVSDYDDAKDVLQNSFVKIFTSISRLDYRGEDSFKAWMKRIVANEALTQLKRKKRLVFMEHNNINEEPLDEEPRTERISADELHELICKLPDGYRMVLNLYIFEGYSHRQIAEMLNISESTSASQFYHAKRLLAKSIKELIKSK